MRGIIEAMKTAVKNAKISAAIATDKHEIIPKFVSPHQAQW